MRICIVGSGAVGGLIGLKLSLSGHEVIFIDRGKHLQAIQRQGLKLIMQDGREFIAGESRATENFREAGPQDIIVLALKAHQIPEVAEKLPFLFGSKTALVTVQNGIPWWYFQKHGGEYNGRRLVSLDPTGVIESNIDPDCIIGCVVYFASEIKQPGVVQHVEGDRLPIGELDGSDSQRCRKLHQAFSEAGFRSRILDNIRAELWLKAWGTLSFNPVSALSHATLQDICRFPETRILAADMMAEAQNVAAKLGITFRHTIARRIDGAESVGPHKTSMLQDIEAGRDLEIEALVGSVIELGRLTGTPTPAIDAVYACTKLLGQTVRNAGARVELIPKE